MQFLYDEKAGESKIYLKDEAFHHLKVRRIKQAQGLNVRNLRDEFLYHYVIDELQKNSCVLILQGKSLNLRATNKTSLALGVIDPKILEKTLPFLNELGLYKLILVFTAFSQRNFVLDFDRLNRILINSCQQCGRGDLMQFECFNSTQDFANAYKNAIMLDFSAKSDDFSVISEKDILFVGAEGGFNDSERALFERKIKLKSPYILKSQSTVIAAVAKILL